VTQPSGNRPRGNERIRIVLGVRRQKAKHVVGPTRSVIPATVPPGARDSGMRMP